MNVYLESMPQANEAMRRVEAWYHGETMGRPPIRFSEHNSSHNKDITAMIERYGSAKQFWFDAEYHVCSYVESLAGKTMLAETFPVFFPNLGPSVFASYYGVQLEYAATTSWAQHMAEDMETFDASELKLCTVCENWNKIDEITKLALELGKDKFLTGYTDLHPSLDCVADFVGPEGLCMALYDCPKKIKAMADVFCKDFEKVFAYYHQQLKTQPSVTWMGIPSAKPMHIPSCDFASMLSPAQFEEFALPYILREIKLADYNIFHMDGIGVAQHLDQLLEIKEIQAIQWVQGVGEDEPIMQWVPLIQKIQNAGKGVVVGIQPVELKDFMREVSPKGIYLTMNAEEQEQSDIVKLVENWK